MHTCLSSPLPTYLLLYLLIYLLTLLPTYQSISLSTLLPLPLLTYLPYLPNSLLPYQCVHFLTLLPTYQTCLTIQLPPTCLPSHLFIYLSLLSLCRPATPIYPLTYLSVLILTALPLSLALYQPTCLPINLSYLSTYQLISLSTHPTYRLTELTSYLPAYLSTYSPICSSSPPPLRSPATSYTCCWWCTCSCPSRTSGRPWCWPLSSPVGTSP